MNGAVLDAHVAVFIRELLKRYLLSLISSMATMIPPLTRGVYDIPAVFDNQTDESGCALRARLLSQQFHIPGMFASYAWTMRLN